ncbi:MAG: hypothetical protein JNJ91_07855 [Flavobacteriales bacterium]|nr:hypothetical protein [Flavobacteriales bacterium]
MIVTPGVGIGPLRFGDRRSVVKRHLGNPDEIKRVLDSDGDVQWVYNDRKLRLTFYSEHDMRLGYARCSHPNLSLFGKDVIGATIKQVLVVPELRDIQFVAEEYDMFTSYFNEDAWLLLNVEYQCVNEVEIGVPFKNDEEYNWPTTKTSRRMKKKA